jgi:hypothetical protein
MGKIIATDNTDFLRIILWQSVLSVAKIKTGKYDSDAAYTETAMFAGILHINSPYIFLL